MIVGDKIYIPVTKEKAIVKKIIGCLLICEVEPYPLWGHVTGTIRIVSIDYTLKKNLTKIINP